MVEIRPGDLDDPEVVTLLEEHLREMHEESCEDSCHALDLSELHQSEVTFWTAHDGLELAGCAAVKQLDATHGEIKSMRTTSAYRGKGIGKLLLKHIIKEARQRSCQRLSLETGSMEFFEPARKLYEKFGFVYCEPFEDYSEDPNSVFMTLNL